MIYQLANLELLYESLRWPNHLHIKRITIVCSVVILPKRVTIKYYNHMFLFY